MGQDPLSVALREGCVTSWLGDLAEECRGSYESNFRTWLTWLQSKPDWNGKLPSQLLEYQVNAVGKDRYTIPRLIHDHVQECGGTYSGMITRQSHLRSLFHHGCADIPARTPWPLQPTKDPVESELTVPKIQDIIGHASLRDTAILLTMFQGLMDLKRFTVFNRKYAKALVAHLKAGKLDEPFRMDFVAGRKKNRRPYWDYLHRDALQAWQTYFERERGWPREGEPIAVTDIGVAPQKEAIRSSFDTIARKQKIKPEHNGGERTGISPHEFRDVARSHLQTAKAENFDELCAEFWMGHAVDKYNYNKFKLEPEYVLTNAKIAAKYLNILTGTTIDTKETVELRDKVAHLELAVQMLQEASGLKVVTTK